jgi:hypothetical protein
MFCQLFQNTFDSRVADIVAIDQQRDFSGFLHNNLLFDTLKFFRLVG